MGINTPGTELQNHIGKQTVAGQLPTSAEFTNYEPAAVKLAGLPVHLTQGRQSLHMRSVKTCV